MRRSCVPAAVAVALLAPAVSAVVIRGGTEHAISQPLDAYVGRWNGSSGVPIDSHWVLTARHNNGGVGQAFFLDGEQYRADAVFRNPTADLMLVHVARELPGFSPITDTAARGDRVVLGGYGRTAAQALARNTGFDWTGRYAETWARNNLEYIGTATIGVRFDAGSSGEIHEGGFAINDSGGGIFHVEPDLHLTLLGIAVSVSTPGKTVNGSWSYAIDVRKQLDWINSVIENGAFPDPSADPGNGSLIPAASTSTMFFALIGAAGFVRRRR